MKVKRWIITFALLLSSLAMIVVSYRAGHSFRDYLTENSDLLYLPTLFSDLISRGGHLSDWFLTPAPYFFPDYPLYLIAYALAHDTFSRIAMFAVAQAVLTFYAIWLLARRVSPSNSVVMAATITIGLIWLALNAGEPFVILLASASHYGIFVSAILFVALWLEYRTNEGRAGNQAPLLAAICMLAFLSALSDNLFIVQVIVPFAATAIVAEFAEEDLPMSRTRHRLIAAWALLAFVVPALMYRLPMTPPSVNVAWSSAVDDQQRVTLETRFHLTDGDFRGGRLWTYRITDTSRPNIRALVGDSGVQDTEHIDRLSFTVDGASGPLRRSVATLPIGVGISTFIVIGSILVSIIWSRIRQRRSLRLHVIVLLPVIFSALGFLSYNVLVSNPTRYPPSFGLEKAPNNLGDLYVAVDRTMVEHPLIGVCFIGYLALMVLVYARGGRSRSTPYRRQLRWLAVFSALSLCSVVVMAGLMTDLPVMPRYLIPAFFWPVVIVVLFAGQYLTRRFFAVGTLCSALAVVSMGFSAKELVNKDGLSARYYPSEIACIDAALEKEGLRNGIAQYWDAKYLQEFSRLDLNIAQYLENLEEMKWITSNRYFRPSYDFAVVAEDAEPTYKISAETLSKFNGPPKQVVSCGNRSVYIYGRDKLRTASAGG